MLTVFGVLGYYYRLIVGIVAQVLMGHLFWAAWFGHTLDPNVYNTKERRRTEMFLAHIGCLFMLLPLLILCNVWLSFPLIQDIPQYFAENYSITEGTVSRLLSGSNSLEVYSDVAGKIRSFVLPDIEGIEEGDTVEIAHLNHSCMGTVTKVNGEERLFRRHTGKAFLSCLIILDNIFMIFYTLLATGAAGNPHGKKYGTKVYLCVYKRLLLAFDAVMVAGAFMALLAIGKAYNQIVDVMWSCLLLCGLILSFVLLGLTQQKIVVKGEDIDYKHFTTCYKGKTGDIVNLELNDRNQLVIIMRDGKSLVVNDRKMSRNLDFYYRLKRELPEEATCNLERTGERQDVD